jgi:hypothetical protein
VNARRPGSSRRVTIAAVAAAAALIAPASASAHNHRQSTLSLALEGSAVQGQLATIVASGTNSHPESGSYYLFIYAKDSNVDPTCAPTQEQESQTFRNNVFNPATAHAFDAIAIGQLESYGPGTFNIQIKKAFETPGRKLLCAYSTFIAETAVATQMIVDVAPSGGGSTGGGSGDSGGGSGDSGGGNDVTTAAKPVNRSKPRVTRKGRALSCSRGKWTNAAAYRYSWVVKGKVKKGARSRKLSVTRAVRGSSVKCRVTAYNAAGRQTAVSRSYRVR